MTNANGVTQFDADYYPHGTPRVVNSTKDVLLKFQGRQFDSESGLVNARRMSSPSLARALPTSPTKPNHKPGVPAPQSLNAYPQSIGLGFGNGSLFISISSPGSEGNEQCVEREGIAFYEDICAYRDRRIYSLSQT